MILYLRLAASTLALSISFSTSALAQGEGRAPSEEYVEGVDLDVPSSEGADIVVTGTGLEPALSNIIYSTVTIDREQIVATGSGRLEDVLSNVAGFQQFRRSDSRSSNPSAQGVTLRALGGNATSRALVLLDGVPVSDPFFGYIPFNSVAPDALSSVRVTRGGGSGPFGSGALAGTIELESAGLQTLGSFSGGVLINDRAETETTAAFAQKLGAGFAVVTGRWDRGEGFFTTPEDQRAPISTRGAFDSWNVAARAVAPLSSDIEVQARIGVFDDRRTLRFEGADSSSKGQDASLRIVGRGNWEFDALAYVQARNFSNVVISSTRFVRVLDQRKTPSTGLGGKVEVRPPVAEAHDLRLGADYRRADGELQEEAYSAFSGLLRERRRAGGTNSNLGLFLEDDWQIGPIVLTGGLRADYTRIQDGFYRARNASGEVVSETIAPDRSDWAISWRTGVSFYASRQLELRAAAYTGSRLPTLNELYRPFVVFPIVTQANAGLENERLEGFEVGLNWQPARSILFSLTAFDNEVKNAIANVTLEPNLRQRQNLPSIKAQGLEWAMAARFGAVSIDASLAYTDAQIAGDGSSLVLDGNRPPQTPELSASATLSWEPSEGWRMAGTLRHVGAQFEDDQETSSLPAATTFDLFAQASLTKTISLVARVENLLDETIVTRNSNGAIDLGVPRTVWFGVRIAL